MFVRQRYFKYLFYWIIYRYFYIIDLHSIEILTQFFRSISSIYLIIHSLIFYIVYIYIYIFIMVIRLCMGSMNSSRIIHWL